MKDRIDILDLDKLSTYDQDDLLRSVFIVKEMLVELVRESFSPLSSKIPIDLDNYHWCLNLVSNQTMISTMQDTLRYCYIWTNLRLLSLQLSDRTLSSQSQLSSKLNFRLRINMILIRMVYKVPLMWLVCYHKYNKLIQRKARHLRL